MTDKHITTILDTLVLIGFAILSYAGSAILLLLCKANDIFAPQFLWQQFGYSILFTTFAAHVALCCSYLLWRYPKTEKPFLRHFDQEELMRLLLPSALLTMALTAAMLL